MARPQKFKVSTARSNCVECGKKVYRENMTHVGYALRSRKPRYVCSKECKEKLEEKESSNQ